jgi:hypothetical protein
MQKNRRHRKRQRASTRREDSSGVEFSTFSISDGNHEHFKKALLNAARETVAAFPTVLELLKDHFRNRDPTGIMASFSMYGLQVSVDAQGRTRKLSPNLEQHHAELLQAVLLTIPSKQWGSFPVSPDIMESVYDNVPKLAETFFHQRLLAGEAVSDDQELAVLSLQERIRLHTQAVRNWGYYSEVIKIVTELYGSLDARFAAYHGFSVNDLIGVMKSVVAEFERRANEHWSTLQKVIRGGSVRELVRLYYKHVPDLKGTPDEMISTLPSGITREGAMGLIMSHFDLRLSDRATFTPAELATLTGRQLEVTEKILKAVSLAPGILVDATPEHLFLSNPVWAAPGIDLSDRFLFAFPQAVFSHIHDVVRRLGEAAGLKEQLGNARARYLESKLEETLKMAFPCAAIKTGVKWEAGGQQFETDALVVIDRVVVIAEAKSHRLTAEGLRGAPERLKRHVQDLVLDPSVQSARLEGLITAAQAGDLAASALVGGLGIDARRVDHVIRLSVTLDDFSLLSSAESEFKKIGWIPADHLLAPTVHIADLRCITDILDSPVLMLHYLSERTHLQKSFNLFGDELDFVGLYLLTGFNIAALEKVFETDKGHFSLTGMSGPIDRYYTSLDAGGKQPKPSAKLALLYRAILERLTARRPEGWTTIGLHLLGSANFEEQRRVENQLSALRKIVRRDFHKPDHLNSLRVKPPQDRKGSIIFYLFPEALRATRREAMEQLANQALDEPSCNSCVVFGRCTEGWDVPYEAICFARKDRSTSAGSSAHDLTAT